MHVRNIVNFRILYEARAVPYNKSPDVIAVVPAIFFLFYILLSGISIARFIHIVPVVFP